MHTKKIMVRLYKGLVYECCHVKNVNRNIEQRFRNYSWQLITNNKRFNVRESVSQRINRFYTQIMVLLKPTLFHVHLRNNAIPI